MAFALAEAFVDIVADPKKFNSALVSVKKDITALKPHFDALVGFARKMFLGLAGAAGFAVKQQADEEEAQNNLRAALRATGQEVDRNAAKLVGFANWIQDVTVYSNDAVENLMAFATNLGVTADQMQGLVEVGIGLGKSFFGGDEKAGIEAAAKATQGNVRALKQMIPELKNATSAQDALDIVTKRGMQGFKQAIADTETSKGGLKQLWNAVGDLAKVFGEFLIPNLKQVTYWSRAMVGVLQNMTPEQKSQVMHWLKVAGAVAAVIAFGPPLIGFVTSAITGFVALEKVLVSLGGVLISAIFSPFGLVLAGISAAVAGFAYFAGTGDTVGKKFVSGFKVVIDIFDIAAGSWQGFKDFVMGGVDFLGHHILNTFYKASAFVQDAWEVVTNFFGDAFDGVAVKIGEWSIKIKGFFKNLAVSVAGIWSAMIDSISNVMLEGWISLQEKMGKISKKEADEQRAYAVQERAATNKGKAQERIEAIAGNDKETQDQINALNTRIGQRVLDRDAATAKRRNEIEKERLAALDGIKQIYDEKEEARKDRLAKNERNRLSNRVKDLLAAVQKGLNFDDMQKQLKQLMDDLAKSKKDAEGADPKLKAQKNASKDKPPVFTKVEDVFKQQIAKRMFAFDAMQRQQAKDEEDRRVKREHLKEAQKQTELMKRQTNILDNLGWARVA